MSKKNIVSIEDRIPKLKQARKKKANRRLIFYLSIFFILISVIVYLQSPWSNIKAINVNGNLYISDDEVIEYSKLTTNSNIWTINKTDIENLIVSNPLVESASLERKLPWTVQINVTEHQIIGYLREGSIYYPVMGNGEILEVAGDSFSGDAPLIFGFDDENYLKKMAEELEKLPVNILDIISEIHWKPTEENKNNILLYMNDGYLVKGTIRDFADKMEVYPSIVSQLDPEEKGIIHIGVGVYFESFHTEEDETETDTVTEEEIDFDDSEQ
ncbi:cell division protein FtsQ/DivIB [Oceanobacillus saliphilus]|uniref:cell division protein FtsQ/DivIB n=1 Tax=Oceanobacillus saliphilus TaxID=2925834 RepID=UPI00201D600C|nr:cell division protein FtsQ/DivIB [Oceanobacillus saliphilus]